MKKRMNGFSLLELSVVVLILGMLTVLLIPWVGARFQQREKALAQTLLERADGALTGFIMSNDRLPCPAPAQNGVENCDDNRETGFLPYKTLGMADARAGQVRYGVLRRRAIADPAASEGASSAKGDASDRTVDLAVKGDRFYPLLALIGVSNAASAATTDLPDLSESVYLPVESWNVPFGAENGLDFCFGLRAAEDVPPAAADISDHVHVVVAPEDRRQVAYALALPGALETGAPTSSKIFDLGKARMRAVTPGALWKRLECGEAMASVGHAQPNLVTAAVMLYRGVFDFEQSLQEAKHLTEVQVAMADMAYLNASVKLPASATASTLKIIGALIAGKAEQGVALAKAIYSATVATTSLGGSQASQASNKRSNEMATERYEFVQKMRASMKELAQAILDRVRAADSRGLYQGKTS
jgi:prepilin-type N-terminal cleavage/methylation domain-containing protein